MNLRDWPRAFDAICAELGDRVAVVAIGSDESLAAVNAVRARLGLDAVPGTASIHATMTEIEAALCAKSEAKTVP